ncbi:MAG: LamG-like jellyroll fold domain-containing protein, partial [Candidatus Nanohaloarchaea archaeon]|nr:LamG-like jellyroll fold domain-containing protein [Candidatus Nanohaloarchaea archaeon]
IPSNSDNNSTDGRIPLGTSGTGDDSDVFSPTVIKDNGTYKMWYSGKDGSKLRIYMATSPNGTFWTKVNNNIPSNSDNNSTDGRIPLGTTGTGDDNHALAPTVIKDGNTYKMWYPGHDGSNYRIYMATLDVGVHGSKLDPGWHNIVGTVNSTHLNLYVDGKLEASNTTKVNSVSNNANLLLGDLFNGSMDETRIYNRTLSGSEVRELYFQGRGEDSTFKSRYNRTFEVADDEIADNITVDAENVNFSLNRTLWVNVSSTNGERALISVPDGSTVKGYQLNFTKKGGNITVEFNVSSSNATVTPIVNSFDLWTVKGSISIKIHNPPNSTISDVTPWLNVTADNTVSSWFYNVDSDSNTSFTPNITLSALTEGRHNVTVWANDSVGNYNRSVVWFRVDTTPPTWRNQMQNVSEIQPDEAVSLSAQGRDTVNLSHAMLSTNESGGFVNKTGVYNSSQRFYKEDVWKWSNFTWS